MGVRHSGVAKYPLEGRERVRVRVLDVIDGDTVAVAVPPTVRGVLCCGDVEHLRVLLRLRGVDCPERRTAAGQAVKRYVESLVGGRARITTAKWDKFGGRVVGDVHLASGKTLSAHLLALGLAKPFDGRSAKTPWTEGELREIVQRKQIFRARK